MMDLKTYRGSSMAEALAEVKKDLGKDAVILHARTTKTGGVLGFGGSPLVEITAAPADAAGRTPRRTDARSSDRAERRIEAGESEAFSTADWKRESDPALTSLARAKTDSLTDLPPAASSAPGIDPLAVRTRPVDIATLSPRARAEAKAQSKPELRPVGEPSGLVAASIATPAGAARLSTPVKLAPESQAAWTALEDELSSIKRLVGQVLQAARRGPVAGVSTTTGQGSPAAATVNLGALAPALFAESMLLLDAGLEPGVSEQIIGLVRDELEPAEMNDASIVRAAVLRHLAGLLPTKPAANVGVRDGLSNGPLTIALIGPTGVGKTTTIAKLAATYKLRHGRRVGLITSDTYRIAAVDQLRTYANIIGLPLKVALTPQEMTNARVSLADCDVLLIDTAGRAPTDAARLEELRRFVDAARPDEVYLTLSANCTEQVMTRAAERFCSGVLQPTHLVVTKLDEAVTLGGLVNVLPRIGVPIGYVTTGQEVPDQIETASSERLARLVLARAEELKGGMPPTPVDREMPEIVVPSRKDRVLA